MKKVSALILSIIFLTSFTVFAQHAKGDMPPFQREGGIKKMLKLTPEQEKKFDDITYKQKQEVIDLHAKIQKNRLELKKMIDENAIDEKSVLQLTDDNSKLQGDIKHSVVKRMLDIYKILNDDQKAMFVKHIARMANPQVMKERFKNGARKFMMRNRAMRMNQGGF